MVKSMKVPNNFKYRVRAKEEVFELIKNGIAIDLVKIFELELRLLRMQNNPYAIARYIYIRIGELFQYDTYLEYANEENRKKIRNKMINIRNVTDFSFVCDQFAVIYTELLSHFGINAKIVDTKEHVYVIYTLEEKVYLADLTSGNEDITRIKFGLRPILNRQIFPTAPKDDKTFDEIDKEISCNKLTTEEALNILKQELIKKQISEKWDLEEYTYQVYKVVENIINFERPSIGFISGVTYIYFLLKFFIKNYEIYNTHILNEENGFEIEVFSVKRKNSICYFSFQEEKKGFFKLHEVSENELNLLLKNKKESNIINKEHLKLLKKLEN